MIEKRKYFAEVKLIAEWIMFSNQSGGLRQYAVVLSAHYRIFVLIAEKHIICALNRIIKKGEL